MGLSLDANSSVLHYNLGQLLLEQAGDLQGARKNFRRAVQLEPMDAEAHNSLGAVLQYGGDAKEAASSFKTALRLRPKYAEAHYNLGLALVSLGDEKGAEKRLRAA